MKQKYLGGKRKRNKRKKASVFKSTMLLYVLKQLLRTWGLNALLLQTATTHRSSMRCNNLHQLRQSHEPLNEDLSTDLNFKACFSYSTDHTLS